MSRIGNNNGRWIERGLLLAVLLMQVVILVQLRATSRRDAPAPVASPSLSSGGYPEEDQMRVPALSPGLFALPRHAAGMDSMMDPMMDPMMAGAMENVARLHSAVQFLRGWEMLNASPSLDMRDTDGDYLVTFSIPDVEPDGLGVMLDGRVLTVRAECGGTLAHPGSQRCYERRVLLPGPVGEAEDAQAQLTNGILRVRIPKGDGLRPHRDVMRLF
jgi:HSP20 family molecular chaperone IbpA